MSEPAQSAATPSLGATADTPSPFRTAVIEALEMMGAPPAVRKKVEHAAKQEDKLINAQAEKIQDLQAEVADLEAELEQERETRAKEAAEDRKRIHEVETQVNETTDGDTTDSSTEPDLEGGSDPTTPRVEPPETPLEDVIRVPEHLVEEHLTANQRRARFVAKDVAEYTRSVPAGRAIRSSQLRQVLAAGEDGQIYTETVSRVIRFLDELGGDTVTVNESRRGERVVVFTEAFVERVQTYRHAQQASNTVVTRQGVKG